MKKNLVFQIQAFKDQKERIAASSVCCKDISGGFETILNCAHAGVSMNPTLNELDLLGVAHYGDKPLRLGDVIFFMEPEANQLVVHRIVSFTGNGIRTRGDNSTRNDPWSLKPTDIIGQVVVAWRGQKRRKIAGGPAAYLRTLLIRNIRNIDQGISRILLPAYRSLSCHGIMRRLMPDRFRPRIVTFKANGKPILRLLVGRRLVGQYNSPLQPWSIQRPFRLFVDEKSLP